MLNFEIVLSNQTKQQLQNALKAAQRAGNLPVCKRIMAILAIGEGRNIHEIASLLKICTQSIIGWVEKFMLFGLDGLKSKKSPGRPPKLTKTQKRELEKMIEDGPDKAGFPGNCWRSPMIQHLINKKFGVFYSVFYISQLLDNMGFSFQKAKFESDHINKDARQEWLQKKWPAIFAEAKRLNALLLFGDEASFPQWGTLSYTWARKGQQPTIKTSGKRKAYKVFGLIDYFTGSFFSKCQEGRLNSETYTSFLEEVILKTDKHIILIQDGARYHTSKAMNEFFAKNKDRITVHQLPTYSPDFNPIEKLWKKVKEKGTHLQYFPTFDSLKNKVEESLVLFENAAEEVLSLFGFYEEKGQAVSA